MADVLAATAPHDAIVAAVEQNWRAALCTFGLAPGTTIRDDAELFWYVTGLPDPSFNSIMYANLAPDRIDAAVEELHALRRRHGVPVNWVVGPTSRPLDLPDQLRARGLRHLLDLTPLTLTLADLRDDDPPPPGLWTI